MNIRVLFFATMREKAGVRNASIELPEGADIAVFKKILVEQYPALAPAMSTVLIAVNKEFAFDDQVISDSSEVAVFPPVSGG